MPISREAFQLRIHDGADAKARWIGGGQARRRSGGIAREFGDGEEQRGNDDSQEDYQGGAEINAEGSERLEDKTPEAAGATMTNLPPADAASAGSKDSIGPDQPQTETRRSVATGRDAPEFPGKLEDGESNGPDGEGSLVRTETIERRLQGHKGAVTEHLGRIEGIVEGLMELAEAHLFDGGQKLQALEQKLAQMETRFSMNRTSP